MKYTKDSPESFSHKYELRCCQYLAQLQEIFTQIPPQKWQDTVKAGKVSDPWPEDNGLARDPAGWGGGCCKDMLHLNWQDTDLPFV